MDYVENVPFYASRSMRVDEGDQICILDITLATHVALSTFNFYVAAVASPPIPPFQHRPTYTLTYLINILK